MSTIKDRIFEFIKHENISRRGFSASINRSSSYVNNIVSTISAEVMQEIRNVYPQLNIDWLLTGEGEMLLANKAVDSESPPVEQIAQSNIDALVNIIDKLSDSDKRNSQSIEVMSQSIQELIAQGRDQVNNITKLVNLLCQNGVDIASPVIDKEKGGLSTSGKSDKDSASDADRANVG